MLSSEIIGAIGCLTHRPAVYYEYYDVDYSFNPLKATLLLLALGASSWMLKWMWLTTFSEKKFSASLYNPWCRQCGVSFRGGNENFFLLRSFHPISRGMNHHRKECWHRSRIRDTLLCKIASLGSVGAARIYGPLTFGKREHEMVSQWMTHSSQFYQCCRNWG